jgi:hypothetical protein
MQNSVVVPESKSSTPNMPEIRRKKRRIDTESSRKREGQKKNEINLLKQASRQRNQSLEASKQEENGIAFLPAAFRAQRRRSPYTPAASRRR